ncbi:LOW QUALITY PROTEIN: hypothetical protein CRUP_012357 [Coryphaenoides rupestris]|nr:LOW QUALITY PROTEIN: hypothetical protein CRUP_012357 [Coryphaenoides rupestris]
MTRDRSQGDTVTVGGVSSDVVTVGGVSSDTVTVGGVSSDTVTVGGVSKDAVTVGGVPRDAVTVGGVSREGALPSPPRDVVKLFYGVLSLGGKRHPAGSSPSPSPAVGVPAPAVLVAGGGMFCWDWAFWWLRLPMEAMPPPMTPPILRSPPETARPMLYRRSSSRSGETSSLSWDLETQNNTWRLGGGATGHWAVPVAGLLQVLVEVVVALLVLLVVVLLVVVLLVQQASQGVALSQHQQLVLGAHTARGSLEGTRVAGGGRGRQRVGVRGGAGHVEAGLGAVEGQGAASAQGVVPAPGQVVLGGVLKLPLLCLIPPPPRAPPIPPLDSRVAAGGNWEGSDRGAPRATRLGAWGPRASIGCSSLSSPGGLDGDGRRGNVKPEQVVVLLLLLLLLLLLHVSVHRGYHGDGQAGQEHQEEEVVERAGGRRGAGRRECLTEEHLDDGNVEILTWRPADRQIVQDSCGLADVLTRLLQEEKKDSSLCFRLCFGLIGGQGFLQKVLLQMPALRHPETQEGGGRCGRNPSASEEEEEEEEEDKGTAWWWGWDQDQEQDQDQD